MKIKLDDKWVIYPDDSDETYLYVEVVGYGRLQIKRETEGLVVDVFSLITDQCVATLSASFDDLDLNFDEFGSGEK